MDTAFDTRNVPPAAAQQLAPPVVAKPQPSLLRRLLPVALLLLLGGGGYYGYHWWMVGRFEETTDDAFLQSDKVVVAPRIAGVVATVAVADNQAVNAGDVLAHIDDRDYQIALTVAQADQAKAQATLLSVGAAIVQQGAQIDSAQASIVDAEAGLSFSGQEAMRYRSLMQTGSGTLQRQQQTD
ncbi:MAG: biotin/lipoyl-binding protein, partial [Janthinobacterium lividum]